MNKTFLLIVQTKSLEGQIAQSKCGSFEVQLHKEAFRSSASITISYLNKTGYLYLPSTDKTQLVHLQ